MCTRPSSADPCNQRYRGAYPAVSLAYLPYLWHSKSQSHIDMKDTPKTPQDTTWGIFNRTNRSSSVLWSFRYMVIYR